MTVTEEPVRVLFVDDDELLLRTLRRGFSLSTFAQSFAPDGDAALALLAREPIDVIVTDQRMPGMSGVELLQRVRASWPDIVRVMLTGDTDRATALQAVNDGHIFAFINKPWEPVHLHQVMRSAIDEARRLRALAAERRAARAARD